MSSNSTYAIILTSTIGYISLYINFITIIAGTIGGICNLITYSAPRLRKNACVFYLLCATILEIFSILIIVPTRIALDSFGNNLENQSILFCKLRYFISIVVPKLVTYYILLAIVDRCLATSSNVRIRSWSQLKVAHQSSMFVLIIGTITGIHILVFYNIFNAKCQVPAGNAYTIFFAVYLVVIVSLLPHTLMFIFSLITFRNFKRTRQRIIPIVSGVYSVRTKRSDSQLISLVVIQVIISSILVLLRLGSYTYSTLTSGNLNKNANEIAAENFALKLGFSLYYFSFATSFYFSTLTRKFFRNIFCKRVRALYNFFQHLIN
ncbi:unnamed protein product [Adineta steineri]|uniref:G-protein coupled receptors family 1 profile domain-containing protein n=1 Tax=Adineta steineri TaxID=433720 RepID=A0A815HF45_9BILA|nr:unnamed protein product [Adineta steineri]CAF1354591.1 unnamed protein product [Adineta steineri]CAF3680516.1 unnamed protein product [Adineta steineri]CAF3783433.1 unnamed protein product [Adineta steineri]